MTALATLEPPEVAIPAPSQVRPAHLTELRPTDRIAFRVPETDGAVHEEGPRLTWPREVVTDLPDPAAWCGALVRTCVEVLLGARPPAQLARWLTSDLYTSLSRRAAVASSLPVSPRRVSVLRVHTCEVTEACFEASVVLHDGRRVRAAAVRIEVYRERWRTTALEIG